MKEKEEDLKILSGFLMANEQTYGVFSGSVVGKESIMKDQWLVVTDRRVIYYTPSSSGVGSDSFNYNDISSVQGHKGMLMGDVELNIKDKTEKFRTASKGEVDIMVDMIRKNVEKTNLQERM